MRRALSVLALLLLWPHPARPDNLWRDFESDLAVLRTLHPRPEGSHSSRSVIDLVRERLTSMHVPYRTMDFEDSETSHSFAVSVIANVEGQRPDTVLLCVPVDSSPDDETDGSLAVALALEIARRLAPPREPAPAGVAAAAGRPPLTVQLLFLGAERGKGAEYPMSSRLFLETFYTEKPAIALYLQLDGTPGRVNLRVASDGAVAPLWLVDRARKALAQAGLEASVDGNEVQLVRAGITGLSTPAGPFLRGGYPALVIQGSGDKAAAGDLAFAGSFVDFWKLLLESSRDGLPPEWDRHYLLLGTGVRALTVPEPVYLGILLVVLAVCVAYVRLAHRRVGEDIVIAGEHLWVLPMLFVTVFAFLLAATGIVRAVQAVRGITDLWAASPPLFLGLKISIAILLLFLLERLITRKAGRWLATIPRRFYASSALLLLLLGLVIVGIADVSLTVVLLWPLVFVFIYGIVRRAWAHVLTLVVAPATTAAIGLALVVRPESAAARMLILSPVQGNLVLAVLTLPYVLLFLDVTVSEMVPRPVVRALRRRGPAVAAALTTALLAATLAFPAFGPRRPQVIDVVRYVDLVGARSRVEVTSSAPLGTIRYEQAGVITEVRTRGRFRLLPSDVPGGLLTMRAAGSVVLDRENVSLEVRPAGSPESLEVVVVSDEKFLLFDSSFPATGDDSGKSYVLHIGRYPPVPLTVELTLPRGGRFTITARASYDKVDNGVKIPGRGRLVRSRLVVDGGLDLRT
jgi:hypothetical protein